MVKGMDQAHISIMMAEFIKEISNKGRKMEMVLLAIQMVQFIKASGKQAKEMAKQ